jgi:hypothetical protein
MKDIIINFIYFIDWSHNPLEKKNLYKKKMVKFLKFNKTKKKNIKSFYQIHHIIIYDIIGYGCQTISIS